MICIDLMHEWLWDVRAKISRAEYCLCLSTFILIQIIGVEYGILAGVGLYFLCRKLGVDLGEAKQMPNETSPTDDDKEDDILTADSPMPAKTYGSTESP